VLPDVPAQDSIQIDFDVLMKDEVSNTPTFLKVAKIASALRAFLNGDGAQQLIRERHTLNAASQRIQEIFLDEAIRLGFEDEKNGLFSSYKVSALRPDYFCRVDDSGILLEVERGKTTINNMDLLDLWKCHICEHADYLFLVVPKVRLSANGSAIKTFAYVRNRLAPFFEPKNYVNVDAVYLFGY
jgi:hypothetical protein